jgi:hypothetical protein
MRFASFVSGIALTACSSSGTHAGAGAGSDAANGGPTGPGAGSSDASGATSDATTSSGDDGGGSTTSPSDAAPSDAGAITDGPSSTPSDGGPLQCKRGIAANAGPTAVFAPSTTAPGIVWWYNWATKPPAGATPSIPFVPMIWGAGSLNATIPAGSEYLLGFNEPNFSSQSDLTPTQAAADWPSVEAIAATQNLPIVSPAVNFCGGCSDPSITDPYTWLKDFFAACADCKVDYIAVHWYNCDLPSLQGYIEGNDSGLEGFVQFGKPIWLTEFSCDNTHSPAEQQAYMKAAVPYLESNPHVMKYAWFSAAGIPNALLADSDAGGALTDLGQTYVGLAQNCQ